MEAEWNRPFLEHPQVFVCHLDAPWENPIREAEAMIRRINPTAVVLGMTEDQLRAVEEQERTPFMHRPSCKTRSLWMLFMFRTGATR